MIAIGRTLTGHMPDDVCVEDFKTYTYGFLPLHVVLIPNPSWVKRHVLGVGNLFRLRHHF